MEQQRVLLINFKAELTSSTTDILEENNFVVKHVESLEKISMPRQKNFLRNPS